MKRTRGHIPVREAQRVLQDVSRNLPDLWDQETAYLLIRRQGGRFKVEPCLNMNVVDTLLEKAQAQGRDTVEVGGYCIKRVT